MKRKLLVIAVLLGVLIPALIPITTSAVIFTSNPNTQVGISASSQITKCGNTVMLTVTEKNTGNVPLAAVYVVVSEQNKVIATLGYPQGGRSLSPMSGDTNGDMVLDVGETWMWKLTVNIKDTTKFTAVGHGLDILGRDITYPKWPTERSSVTVRTFGQIWYNWRY